MSRSQRKPVHPSRQECSAAPFRPNRITAALLVSMGLAPAWAAADANHITVHGGNIGGLPGGLVTDTQIKVQGTVTDITTGTVRGNTGFNSFGHFQVGSGNTVNLHVPDGKANLVNLVHDSKAVINGTLNGLKDGSIGGNVIFADPHGLVVGASGVVNVGSLTVTTPSLGQMIELGEKVAAGQGDEIAAGLEQGRYHGGNGEVRIEGRLNSAAAVNLFAASAVVASGARIDAGAQVFGATVNTDGLLDASAAVRQDGAIRIVADKSVAIAGELAALMADGAGGGVTVKAPSIRVENGARIVTRAESSTGHSGDITLQAASDISFTGRNADGSAIDGVDQLAQAIKDQAKPLLAANLGHAEVIIEQGAELDAGHASDAGKAGDISVEALALDKQLGGYAEARADIEVAGKLTGKDISLRASSDASVSAELLGSILDSAALKHDIARLGTLNNWSEAQTWDYLFDTLGGAIDSYDRSSDLSLLLQNPSNFSELTALLPYLSVAIADASARVKVAASAELNASARLDLRAQSSRLVDTSTWAVPGLNGKLPFNLGLAYGRLSGETTVDVLSGAQLQAHDLDLLAHSDNHLALGATAANTHDGNGKPLSTMGLAFGMAHTDLVTRAAVAHGARLQVGNDVNVVALTEQDLSNTVEFKSIGEGASGGPAVALTLFDSSTRALFDADLSGARHLEVSAANLVEQQSNSASVQAGKSSMDHLKAKVMAQEDFKKFTDGLATKVKDLFGMKPGEPTQPTESKFRLASAAAIGIAEHRVEASIGADGSAPSLDLSGNVALSAWQTQAALHNSAESAVNADVEQGDGTKTSISVAASYNRIGLQTQALIGDGVNLSAARIGVAAHNRQSLDLGGLDRWSSLDEVFANLKKLPGLAELPGQVSTVYAQASGESQELALAGSLTVLDSDINATAWVGDGVSLLARADGAWSSAPLARLQRLLDEDGKENAARKALRETAWQWQAPLEVRAHNQLQQLAVAGNLLEALFNNSAGGKAAGAGVNVQVSDNRAVAGIGANGTLTAERLVVDAQQDELLIGIAPSGGKGVSAAGTGSLVVSVVDSTVHASIHHSTTVLARQVGVGAEHRLGLWSAAGALASAEETGVGASVAVNVLNTDVRALIGDNRGWRPADWSAGASGQGRASWRVDELLVDASSSGQSGAFSVAGALARSSAEQQQQDQATAKEGGADKGAMGLAEDLGKALLQTLFGDASAGLENGLDVAKSGASSVKDTVVGVPDALKEAWGKLKGLFDEKPDPGTGQTPLSIAAAGSGSVNVSSQKTRAQLGDILLDPRDPALGGSRVSVLSLNQTNQLSGSGSGALTLAGGQRSQRSSALAGAIAYNHLSNVTEATLRNVQLDDNRQLKVQAASAGDQVAMGLGLAAATGGSQNTSVALSASGGVMMNQTRATVLDSVVVQRPALDSGIAVNAYDRSRVLLGGGAFSFSSGAHGGATSAGGSLVFGLLMNQLHADWLGSTASGFERLDVAASSATRVLAGALAGAVATGAEGRSGSGALALLLLDNDVRARVDRSANGDSALLGGAVNVNAWSVSGMAALDALFDSAGLAALSGTGLDLDGKQTVAQIDGELETKDDLFDADGGNSGDTTAHNLFSGELAGEAALLVAGNLAASSGQSAVGGALGIVYSASDYSASLANSAVDLSGELKVLASNNTDVLAAAIGAAGAKDNAVSGSSTALVARGSASAQVDMSNRTLQAAGLQVQAFHGGGAYSLAGNITASSQNASVGGAISLSDMQQRTQALVSGGTYQLLGDARIDAGQQSRIVTAALSGQVSGSGSAVGGALTFNRIADDTTALLRQASLQAGNLAVNASQPGLGASIRAIAFNLSAAGGQAGVGGAVAVNLIQAERSATIEDSHVSLSGDASLRSSLDGEIWGIGVDASGGGKAGVGGSIVVNVIDGKDRVGLADSSLSSTGGELLLDASAGGGLTIASLSGSIKGGGTAAVGGAISVNRIGAERLALIERGSISGFSMARLHSGTRQDIYAIAVAGGGAGQVAVNGSSTSNVLEGSERAAIEQSTLEVGELRLSAAEGQRTIWSLAGAISGAGQVAVGVANSNNVILAKRVAEVLDSDLTVAGALALRSGGAAHIRSAAVGAGGAGSAAAGASIAVNVIDGEERAQLAGSRVEAASLQVEVVHGEADIKTLAGNVQGAGSGAGAGAVAVSTVNQRRLARIVDSTLLLGAGDARVEAASRATITTLALSGAGGGSAGVAFSNTSNNIAAHTRALVENSAGSAGNLLILASDASSIRAGAGGAAGAGSAAVGAATAINRVDSRIEAALNGDRSTGWSLRNLQVDAQSAASIVAAALAGGGSGTAAAMAVAASNIIQTQALAHIGGGARVLARHNVGVSARNLDSIFGSALVGAVSGNAAVSAIVTVNLIETVTQAYIDGAATEVSALGEAAGDTQLVDDGSLLNGPGDDHQWISGEQFNPLPNLAIGRQAITGLAVQASSIQQVGQLALSASVGVVPLAGAAVAGVSNSTVLGGSTLGYIEAARINQGGSAGLAQNVRVGANSYSYSAGHLAAVAVGASAAGVSAGVDSLVNQRRTLAYLRDVRLDSRGATEVLAGSAQYASSVIANVSAAIVGAGGSASLMILKGRTEALVDGDSQLRVGALTVAADALQSLSPNAASVAGGALAVSGALVTLYDQSITRAWIGSQPQAAAGSRVSVRGGTVAVDAENRTRVLMNVASAGGGASAIGGSIGVAVLETVTEAGAGQADFGAAGERIGSLSIDARDRLDVLANVGSAQAGQLSIGGSANVLVANSAVRALFERSSLHAGSFVLQALREGDLRLNTVTGAVGSSALGGSIGLLLLGTGAAQGSGGDEHFNALDELDKDGNGSLSQANALGGADRVGELSYQDYRWNSVSGQYELVDASDANASQRFNAASRAGLGDRLSDSGASQYRHETVARVGDSQITLAGATRIVAEDRLSSRNLAGNAVAGGAAVGGAFALSLSNARVSAELLGGNLSATDLDLLARATGLGSAPALTVNALSGAVGFAAGLGAAVGVAVLNNRVEARLAGEVGTSATLAGRAEDRQDLVVDALGAAAGVGAGAGLVLGVAKRDSQVQLLVGERARLGSGGDLTLSSLSEGAVSLRGRGAAGGIVAGANASVLVAYDRSGATLRVADEARLSAARHLELLAQVNPKIHAESLGVALGGYLSAGATVVDALARASSSLTLGRDAQLQANSASLNSRIGRQGDAATIDVSALGVSGGVGVALNAVLASARSESDSLLRSDASSRFIGLGNGNWQLLASSDLRQRAATEGYAGGLLTVGAHVAEAFADNRTESDVRGHFSGAIGTLRVAASALVDNQARALAGQGGLVSGAAAQASTRDHGRTHASLYAVGADGVAAALFQGLELSALHRSEFNAFVDSVNASLIGASGAHARNSLNLDTRSELLDDSRIQAYAYEQSARAVVLKDDSASYNVVSGSGGVLNAAAALSDSKIVLDTRGLIGERVRLSLIGDFRVPKNLQVSAFNSVYARDRVKLDSGGAIAIAKADSKIDVSQARALVEVGAGSTLSSIGDILLSASGEYDIDARSQGKTWGLAGAAQGQSLARVVASYDISIKGQGSLLGYGDVRLYAGQDVSGASSQATLVARTDLWNNTAFPVVNDPDADSLYQRDSRIVVSAGSEVNSVGDVYAHADRGYGMLTGKGIAKDLYSEALNALGLSVERTGGSAINRGSAVVRVDGALDSGYYNKRSLHIQGLEYWLDGVRVTPAQLATMDLESSNAQLLIKPLVVASDDSMSYRLVEGTYSQYISARIKQIDEQLIDYGASEVERVAMEAERKLLQKTLDNLFREMGGSLAGGASMPADQSIWIFEVDPILAKPGNVRVIGDALVGSGRLRAPGDAEISVINDSSAFLNILGLEIPYREGGQLLFNNAALSDLAAIEQANGQAYKGQAGFSSIVISGNSPDPVINVSNTYNPSNGPSDASGLRMPAPDIYINGRIFNQRGEVNVTASYGSIYANADIRGKTLRLSAGRDFVLNSENAFLHVGGDPATNNKDGKLTAASGSIVANNNVVISAQYLNINGLIQSGVADWKATISASAALKAKIDAGREAYRKGGAEVIQLQKSDALKGVLGFGYDFARESIVLDSVEVAGGYMELTGYILSTGNGRLNVLDGYSRVLVSNDTGYQLSLGGIDLGAGAQGTLRINDVRRDGQGGEYVWSSVYTRGYDNASGKYGISLREGRSRDVLDAVATYLGDGRSTSYNPVQGRSYVWLTGQKQATTTVETYYKDKFWGIIKTGDGTLYDKKTWTDPVKVVMDGAEYMGTVGSGQASGTIDYREEVLDDGKPRSSSRDWTSCHKRFIWCQIKRSWQEVTTVQGEKVITRHTVRADSPISINFIGHDQGLIDVSSNGNVTLLGSLFNPTGDTRIVAGGSLAQGAADVLVQARNLTLRAGNGIGSAGQGLAVQVGNLISASASAGDIALRGLSGGLTFERLEATRGNLLVSAQGDIRGASGATLFKGHAIDLRSTHGSIGAAGALLNIDSDSAQGQVSGAATLSARAQGGIYLNEVSGDLLVDQVIAGGDIHLRVAAGDLLDGNTTLSYDERSLEQMRELWRDMGLSGAAADAALDEQREALVRAGQGGYERYWQLRSDRASGQTVAFDASQAQLSGAQVAQLQALGWSDESIAAEQLRRVGDYQELHARYGAAAGYDPGFVYTLDAAELAQLQATAAWSEEQLQFSLSSALLSRGSNTQSKVEELNIQGRDVTLEARRVGKLLDDDIHIDLGVGIANLSKAQLAALASAEQDDVYFDDLDDKTRMRIVQRDDVNVAASGTLTVTAQGDVYLGGERDLNIHAVNGDSIRIKTSGNIDSANGSNVVIRGSDVVLEAANGAIGGNGALHLDVSGELTARANLLDLVAHGNLGIQRLTGLDSLKLKVLGDLWATGQAGENLLGGTINLEVDGNAGSDSARIQIGSSGVAEETTLAVAGNAWIGGLQGSTSQPGQLLLGDVRVGGTLDIGQARNLQQNGDWQLGGLLLELGNQWRMAAGSSLEASQGIFARVAGDAVLGNLHGQRLDIEARSLGASMAGALWRAEDSLRLHGQGDIGAVSRQLTLAAGELDIASATGALYLDLLAGIRGGSLVSQGRQRLVSHGDLDLDLLRSRGGAISLDGVGQVSIDELHAQGDLDLAGQALILGNASSAGALNMDYSDTVAAQRLDIAGDWRMGAAVGAIGQALIGGDAGLRVGELRLDGLTLGGDWQLRGDSAEIGTAQVAGQVDMVLGGDLRLGTLEAGDSRLELGSASRIDLLRISGALDLATVGALDLERAEVSGNAELRHLGVAGTALRHGVLEIGDRLVVTGAGDWRGDSVRVGDSASYAVGSARLGSLESLRGDLLLRADGLFAVTELHSRTGLVDLRAGRIELGNATAAGLLDAHATAGTLLLGSARSGADMRLSTASGTLGDIRFGQPFDPADPNGLAVAHLYSAGNLLVEADGDVLGGNAEAGLELRMSGRNLNFGGVQSLREDVFLQAFGDAAQGHGDILGRQVEAARDIGIVASGNLDMPEVRFGGSYSLKAGRDLTVGISGDLNVTGLAEAGRDLTFTVGGAVDLEAIRAGRDVTVVAGGGINLDQGVEAGGQVRLDGGASGIRIAGGILSHGSFEGGQRVGDVLLTAAGDIEVASILARNGEIRASGHEMRLGLLEASQDIVLLAGGRLRVGDSHSLGDQRWQAGEEIFFDRLLAKGQVLLDSLLDTVGDELRAEGGASIQAGWRNGVASAADIRLGQAEAPSLSLWAGRLIRVADASIGQRADLHGEAIELYGRHTGSGQLDLWVEGSGERLARRFDSRLEVDDLRLPRLYAQDSDIRISGERLELADAQGVDRASLQTRLARTLVNNLGPAYLEDADVQLFELDKSFRLLQEQLLTTTDAYVLHRRPSHQVQVPNFSEAHAPGADGLLYQGISAARYGEMQLSGNLLRQRLGSLLQAAGLRRAPVAEWRPAWAGQPIDDLINLRQVDANHDQEEEVLQWGI